jgi:hypothetical protein
MTKKDIGWAAALLVTIVIALIAYIWQGRDSTIDTVVRCQIELREDMATVKSDVQWIKETMEARAEVELGTEGP